MKIYRKHVLVCCTEGCCGARGGEAVYQTFKAELNRSSLTDVLLSKTLCSGACPPQGATVIVHPDGLWYAVATPEEAVEIVKKHLREEQPVERLLLREMRLAKPEMNEMKGGS